MDENLKRLRFASEVIGLAVTVAIALAILPQSLKQSAKYKVVRIADQLAAPHRARKQRRIEEFQLRYDLAEAVRRIEAG